jgi:hypothetical protein
MFFEDLSPCRCVASSLAMAQRLKAVGWLGFGHPYTRRQTQLPDKRFGQLLTLLRDPWEAFYSMGRHECEFCPDEDTQISIEGYKGTEEPVVTSQVVNGVTTEFIQWKGPRAEAYYRRHRIERDGFVVNFGAKNLYIPGEACIYVAPSMIAHYVDVHGYEPPAAFWEAVMKCPEMGSDSYRQALIASGPSNENWLRLI